MQIPDDVIAKLKNSGVILENTFSRIWGLLPPSTERDSIMWHIMTAKKELNEFISKNTSKEEQK